MRIADEVRPYFREFRPRDSDAYAVSQIAVHTKLNEIELAWREFEKTAAGTVFQTFSWLSKWQRHIGQARGVKPVIVVGRDRNGAMAFILPLAVNTRGMIRRLFWLGRELCDYNAPLASPLFLHGAGAIGFAKLWPKIVACLRKELGFRLDVIDLDKMPEDIDGHANPVTRLNVINHPSGAHLAVLGDSWDSYYAAKRSAATRKTERKKLRHLSEYGEVRLVNAEASAERALVMDILIGQKKRWFARMGVNDIFTPRGTREFFMDIATDFNMRDIVHVSELRVGDVSGATGLGLRHKDRYYLILSSYLEDEFAKYGPGRTHLYEMMRGAISKGIRHFDFTVGDEPYKLDWSDRAVKLYDYLQPVTMRGWVVVNGILLFRSLKRRIKQTPTLWRAYQAFRLWKARMQGRAYTAAKPAKDADD